MNTSTNLSKLQQYISQKNIALAASLLVSAFGIWKAHMLNKKREQPKFNIDSLIKRLNPITQREAAIWRHFLSDVKYDLSLSLFHQTTFTGRCIITFGLSEIPENLFLLFQGKEIRSYKINGINVFQNCNSLIRDQRIYIPSNLLLTGINTIEIDYVGNYHNDGSGLLLQVDYHNLPYIYSNCEPFSSQAIFPCFNTMGLRSKFKLKVSCPNEWTAISNEKIEAIQSIDGIKTFEFRETLPIMCYIFVIICGPFCKIQSPKTYKGISSNFYCKQSIAKQLEDQKEEIANLVYHGLEFFESYFGVAYPFSKHDMVYCPEFTSLAMECPGAIVFCDEEFLSRTTPTMSQRIRRAYITLHEMAHMWFGNIINIAWYDEIWIKESFASFFGYFALTSPELQALFPTGWDDIELYKEQGIIWDNLKTIRHPLARGPLLTSNEAEFNYDDINYCKGSGVIKALWAQVGPEAFEAFIKAYFTSNAWKTVTREDLYESLRTVKRENLRSDFDCEGFIKNWLETEGTDTIETHIEESNEQVQGIQLTVQRDPPHSQRNHLLKIALVYSKIRSETGSESQPMDLETNIENKTIFINGNSDSIMIGVDKGAKLEGVICNIEGLDLVKVKIDKKTITYFLNNLKKMRQLDPALETYFWRQLTLMTRNFDYPAEDLSVLVRKIFDDDITGTASAHDEVISRSLTCIDTADPNLAEKIQNYIAEKAFGGIQTETDKKQDYLELLAENAYKPEHFKKSLQKINNEIITKGVDYINLNVGTILINKLLSQEFSKDFQQLIDQFFEITKDKCFEETHRLCLVYQTIKGIDEKELNASLMIERLTSEEILALKPREKRLLWTLMKERCNEIFCSQEYKKDYFERILFYYERFYRMDAYALIESLFPDFDKDNKESVAYLQDWANKFKDQEIILFFIQEKFDELNHKISS